MKGQTVVAAADSPPVYNGLPDEQIVIVERPEAFDALLFCRFGPPGIELLHKSARCAARRRQGRGHGGSTVRFEAEVVVKWRGRVVKAREGLGIRSYLSKLRLAF